MSLFGSSPDDSSLSKPPNPRQSSKNLFENNVRVQSNGSSSLFVDDAVSDSPWSMPTPKKAARGDLIKNLVPAADAPESYVDAFDAIMESGDGVNGHISSTGVTKLLENSSLSSAGQSRLLNIIAPDGNTSTGLDRGAFNVLMALIGLAQEGEEATLDGVDERRKSMSGLALRYMAANELTDLPQPSLPYLKTLLVTNGHDDIGTSREASTPTPIKNGSVNSPPSKPRQLHRNSFNDPEVDPWASSAVPKSTQPVSNDATPAKNDVTVARAIMSPSANRTTSSFTTNAGDPDSSKLTGSALGDGMQSGGGTGPWGSIGNAEGFSSTNTGGLGAGFGSGGDQSNPERPPGRPYATSRTAGRGIEESVTITLLPEKEGMFMFQHRNYEVKSARRGSSVVRRYSDFVWLLDCLHKRYPFRQLPLLPPKRVAGRFSFFAWFYIQLILLVNGRHLSSDVQFIEKRRRGLVRFTNALVRHPVLCQEQLVVMFLTVPTVSLDFFCKLF